MRQARRQLLIAGAVAIVAVGAFVHAVHSGTLIEDDEVAFLSRYDAEALQRRAASAPPRDQHWRLIEDQYATEAVWHVQARNERWAMGDAAGAWGEQRILEKYYGPILASGHDWPPEQRADAERRGHRGPGIHRSHAHRLAIWVLPWPVNP